MHPLLKSIEHNLPILLSTVPVKCTPVSFFRDTIPRNLTRYFTDNINRKDDGGRKHLERKPHLWVFLLSSTVTTYSPESDFQRHYTQDTSPGPSATDWHYIAQHAPTPCKLPNNWLRMFLQTGESESIRQVAAIWHLLGATELMG